MWSTDRMIGACLLTFSALYTAAGWRLATWAKDAPGPGFVPRLLALVLALLAILIWVDAEPPAEIPEETEPYTKREPLIILLLTLAYVYVMPLLGFPLSSFLLVYALRRLIEPSTWWGDLVGAIAVAAIVHGVFVEMLSLQFPVFPVWWES